MQITIKTLKQESFKVEVEESDKVLTIKEKVEQLQGHPVASQKLIFSGKPYLLCVILADENPVSQYNITEKDFLVIMVTKGIPDHLQAHASAPAPAAPRAPAAGTAASANPAATSTPAAAGVASAATTSAQPQNLFTAAAQAAANARRSAETGGAGDGADSLAFLRDQPQFQQIREMVQQNPELLQPLLVQLGQTNPHMLQLINQNQQAFLQLLNEGNDGEEGHPPAGANHIYVTQEEQEAIQRLENLGFDRQTAVEAFLACDRDEQMAANYLFDHGHDDMDEEFQ
ncbi:UV excision repair protein RAD23 B [Linnemannia elongata]|nr:UV excision repair protein RAD23 B [Linnemannia elongata]